MRAPFLRCYAGTVPMPNTRFRNSKKLAGHFAAGKPSYFPEHLSQRKATDVRETIKYLEKTDERPKLISIK